MWAATDKGLNRLRTKTVETLSVADGLVHPEVYPLLEMRGGDIYIGTTQDFSIYRAGEFSNPTLFDKNGDKLLVSALFEDDKKRIWIGTVGELQILENGKLR